MTNQGCDIGMVGLGVMGRNLMLNIVDHGFSVAGYDGNAEKSGELMRKATGGGRIRGASSEQELVGLLKRPRALILLVPTGSPVDAVIEGLLPYLEPSDLIIDSGNSYFKDTDRRAQFLSERGCFLWGWVFPGENRARDMVRA